MSQQSVNKYENHDVEPDIDTLIRIADYFHVSIDYLVGRTDITKTASELTTSDLNNEEQKIIESYRNLTDKQKNCISTIIESYK